MVERPLSMHVSQYEGLYDIVVLHLHKYKTPYSPDRNYGDYT
ncbi:hypothetical protein ACE4RR_03620 [Alteribacillus sp. HJP-4]